MRPAEFTRHWERRPEWPDRDPPGHLYMGSAILRLGSAIYPGAWTDADMVQAGAAKARYIEVRDKLVGWMLDGSLPFATRNERGSHEAIDPLIWASPNATDYADLCRIGRFGGWETYYQPVDVDRAVFEQLLSDATRDKTAQAAKAAIPLAHLEHANGWTRTPDVLNAAMETLRMTGEGLLKDGETAPGAQAFSKKKVARVLTVMWADSGRPPVTLLSFESYLKDNDAYDGARSEMLARLKRG